MALAASGRSRAARQLSLLAFLAVACHDDAASSNLDLLLPDGVGRRVELVPKTAFAEYVELPELRRELRITLASYVLSCDRYVAPGPNDVLFTLTLDAPAAEPFHPGTYPLESADAPDAGPTARAKAFAVARQGERGFVFPNGGAVELRSVDLGPAGQVSGVLALEFPGDGTRPAAGAHGKFEAHLCHGE
ncbi:MAG TPA: hypothetical protein VMI54_16355 [Polyangiaceae bacterium]|nr:hypothetical protein [Polyangiaceae bacterium]